ncbi:MAG: amidohydrolase [candidate division Zixibacteria bacterium]|nr:amidohydrolase [candidate division Zixibacteria bacterium]
MKTLFTNAVIYSPKRIKGDCLAVSDGRIFGIGSKSKLISLKRHGFKVVDLKKKAVLPGFVDSHLHLLSTGYNLQSVDLSGLDTLDKVTAKISKAAKNTHSGQWLLGRGWDKNLWGSEFPDKTVLDKICPKNPVRLFSKDGHAIWVNSLALRLCKINKKTPEPAKGAIMSYSDGSPTGILFENAIDLVINKIPEPTIDFKFKALKKAIKHLNRCGITGAADCDWYANRLNLFQSAREKGFLNLRVFMMLSPDDIDSASSLGLKTGCGDDIITIGALKLYSDGALGSQTAWMFSPYENQPDNFGMPTLSEDELEMYFEKTHLKGISMAVHAIGDRANAELLKFFGKKYAVSKKLGLHHRIEHAQILRKIDIPRFKRYNIAACVQPVHLPADRDMADKYWGKRAKLAFPLKMLFKSGAKIGFSSDSPIESPNPFPGIHAAVARKAPGDNRPAWHPEHSITLKQAIEAYTFGSAGLCGWQNKCGELKPGLQADFVVLSDNIFKVKTKQIPELKVLATVFNGQVVYRDRNFKL